MERCGEEAASEQPFVAFSDEDKGKILLSRGKWLSGQGMERPNEMKRKYWCDEKHEPQKRSTNVSGTFDKWNQNIAGCKPPYVLHQVDPLIVIKMTSRPFIIE